MMRRAGWWVGIVACVVLLCADQAGAQSCSPPVIVQIGGTNPTCAGQPVTLDAGPGASYLWSNGATTRSVTDAPAASTPYTVTVTDANGCVATSEPFTVTVTPAPAAPAIQLMKTTACANEANDAYVPSGTVPWATASWSIVNGVLDSDPNLEWVRFHADGSGPVTLTVTVTETAGCPVSTSTQVPLRTIAPPQISVMKPSACVNETNDAYVPSGNGPWATVVWSIVNGTIDSDPTRDFVRFRADGSGPVTLSVSVTDTAGCAASATSEPIPVRTIPPPEVRVMKPSACINEMNDAYVPPGTQPWATVAWSIVNGVIDSDPTRDFVRFHADGSGPVTLTVSVVDEAGCTASGSSAPIPVRTIPPPGIRLMKTSACVNEMNDAYIPTGTEPFASVAWSIVNGVIDSDPTLTSIRFRADGSGPVTVSVSVVDASGCTASATSAPVTIRQIVAPAIGFMRTESCANEQNEAYVQSGPEPWAAVSWSVTNATIQSGADSTYVRFLPNGSGPVTATVTVTDSEGCTATSTRTAPLRTLVPQLWVQYAPMTPSTSNFARVDPPAEGSWTAFSWTITNGAFDSPAGASSMYFHADGSGPVTLTVTATTDSGCTGTASVTIQLAPIVTPTLIVTYPTVCSGMRNTASVAPPPNGSWVSFGWSITNGSFLSGLGSGLVEFTADGTAPVTLSVLLTDENGAQTTAMKTLPLAVPSPIVVYGAAATTCSGGRFTAGVQTTDYSTRWTASNAVITGSDSGPTIEFMPDGTGPVTLTATYRNEMSCVMTSTATVPLRTVQPATLIVVPERLPVDGGYAYIDDPERRFTRFEWSGTNAYLSVSGGSISVDPYGNGPVTLTCTAYEADGCPTTVTKQILLEGNSLMIDGTEHFCGLVPKTASLVPSSGLTNIQWSIANGTLLSGANDYNVTFQPAGLADVTLTATAKDANNNTISATRTVKYLPFSIRAVSPSAYCANGYANFSLFNEYPWGPITRVQVDSTTNATAVGFTLDRVWMKAIDQTQPISATITAFNADGCSTTVTVTTRPVLDVYGAAIAVNAAAACPNAPLQATITNAVSNAAYSWSIVNGVIDSSPWGPTVTFHANGSGPVELSVRTTPPNFNCSVVTKKTLPLATLPVTIAQSGALCATGGSVTLTATAGSTYLWSTGAITQSITVAAPGDYSVQVTPASGCPGQATTTVVRAAEITPVISASGPTTFCSGGSVTLTSTAGDSYLWSNGATTRSITVTESGSLSVAVTTGGCTATSAPTTVTVQSLPTPVVTASGPTTFCEGGSVELTAPAGLTYVWSTGATSRSITATSAGNYSVTVTDTNGCSATSSSTVVTVNPLPPAAITAGGPTTFCEGGTVTLTASAASSYLWSTGATTQSIAVAASGSYTVTATNSSGCSTTSAATTVTVNAPPATPVITASGPTSVCEGSSVTLTAPAGFSYLWSNGATAQSITVAQAGSFSVTVTDANGCAATSAPVAVDLLPLPVSTIKASRFNRYNALPVGTNAIGTAAETNDVFAVCGPVDVLLAPANLAPGLPPQTYLWSTGATTATISVTEPGTYTLTVTGANGCSSTSSMTVVSNPIPTPSITASGPTTLCPAGGSVTLTASAGDAYRWSNGATTQSIVATAAGTYSVSVTTNGCTGSASTEVTTAQATISANGPTAFCAGGSVTLTASDADSYLWTNGATTRSITVTSAGSYGVTTTLNGCQITAPPVPVSVGPSAVAVTPASGFSVCAGATATFRATVTGGSGGLTYLWTDREGQIISGADTPDVTVRAASGPRYNVLTLLVTDANGCTISNGASIYYLITDTLKPAITAYPAAICGTQPVTLVAPVAESYLWSTGETTSTIVVSTPGSYTVTTTAGTGCATTSDPFVVVADSLPATPVITASGPTSFCPGGSVTLTAPAGYTYQWSTGETTQSITANSTGSYTVTVINANGCSAISAPTTVTVDGQSQPVITAGGPTTFCEEGSVTLTASAGSSYLWSNGATTQSITVGATGNYTVTVTNATGCSATSSPTAITVNPLPEASVTASGPTTFCAGGSVTLTATPASSYLWSNGMTTQSITVSASGSYSVTVRNANGCSATSQPVPVTVNPLPAATITASGPTAFCEGGSVTLSAPAAAAYLWSNGATTQSITVQTAGAFTVTVTSADGCSATSAPTAVTVNPLPAATITPSGPTTFCDSGSVTLTASPGTSYLWSNGQTTQSINVGVNASVGNVSATLTVAVTNASGCTSTSAPVTVTANPLPQANITASGPTTFCAGGSVTLTASDGASYLWSTGATTRSITVNATGLYNVRITNESGCSRLSSQAVVTVNPVPDATILVNGSTTFCEGGSVTLSAYPAASYLWSTGATTQSITVTTAGTYTLTVTNASGCSATSAPKVVTVNPLPVATITASALSFCAGGSVTLTASEGANYVWAHGQYTRSITVTRAGTYTVDVYTAAGCKAAASITITENALPTPAITASGPTTFCAGGSVTLSATGGASYRWSNGATTQAINVTTSGDYWVTVTDANGCSASAGPATVKVNPTPAIPVITASATTICEGSVAILDAPYSASYLWSNGATTRSISVQQSGSYSVTVTNWDGCSSATSAPVAVTVLPRPVVTITPDGPTTFCEGGQVTLTASESVSYSWSNGATTRSITVTTPGDYSVWVTDANGCRNGSAQTRVTVTPLPLLGMTGGGAVCWDSQSYVEVSTVDGKPVDGTLTFLWSAVNGTILSGQGSPRIDFKPLSPTSPVQIRVVVTNANGCSRTQEWVAQVTYPQATITPSGPTTFCIGGSVTLTASGADNYYWSTGQFGSSIAVTQSGTYTVYPRSAGALCQGPGTSITVTVNETVITAQPQSATIPKNTSATLTVAASGPGPLTYQWFEGATGNTSRPVGTGQTFTTSRLTKGTYSYWVRVTGSCSTANSTTAVIDAQ